MPLLPTLFRLSGAILAVLIVVDSARAQDAPTPPAKPTRAEERMPATPPRRLPADSTTKQSLALPNGRTLNFTATAGSIKLSDDKGQELAEIGYVAYQLDGAETKSRPVTFAINGGPGAGSVWLQLGALGPWRLPTKDGVLSPSSPTALVDNDDTWLDFTDLVFIDPPGTGYSLITAPNADEVQKKFWSVDGDIEALSVVIRRWLAEHQRLQSPKFIVGESYGGFRGPRLAEALALKQGVGISGLVLISPVLNFAADEGPWSLLNRLPSYAAAKREKSGPVNETQLSDVEQYATGDYLHDLLQGPRDRDAVARMVQRVAELTGLDPDLVKRLGGRIDKKTFQREIDRGEGKVVGFYDATVSGYDPEPTSNYNRWLDPTLDALTAPMTSAIADLYGARLGWKIDDLYETLSGRVNNAWEWDHGITPPSSLDALTAMLALDPNFRVLVTGGLTDIQVPYLENKLLLAQVPDYGAPGRLTFKTYPGGHMHYLRDGTRKALRDDARRLIEGK
ncbi:S10 family peptidase [Methylovirgula sp. 4M-Z18]|uniref:S10 family peptidase n=1 Tax=Methylovirgula sp. 4M-Z18 TaxID=2293567 RepID=UPI000E2EA39A|nr:peptidase S10 [Methylovirgula sp. 4M-Z18]RFB81492.1 peptidase S10 [Methylovirgula sp. 4M-Z18]